MNPLDRSTGAGATQRRWGYRWVICALLFFATVINYTDRQVLGILAPTLQSEIGWSDSEYGLIVTAFSTAYAIAFLIWGSVIDKVGTRMGFGAAIIIWSLAAMAHALARTPVGFALARFGLGMGEAGGFPAAIKTIAEWFPKKERALATGIFNGGANVGAIVAPLLVPWLTLNYGWGTAFVVTGALGFLWLFFWLAIYRPAAEHPKVSGEELAFIQSDPIDPPAKVKWITLLGYRQTWAFAIAKFMTDPIWWFYLYWLPSFLNAEHGIKLGQLALPLIVVYLLADVGSIAGGWLSSRLIKKGWPVFKGRKAAMLVCALAVVPIIFASVVKDMWLAVGLVALAASAHQGWSANLFTTASDMFPRKLIASVVGIGGFAGAVGGMVFQTATGYILEWTGRNYVPMFLVCGVAYIGALGVLHWLAPKLEPAAIATDVPK
jgi:ACS family hexuronate transporter-like MFS transporter